MAGGVSVVHWELSTAEFAISATTPVPGAVQVSVGEVGLQFGSSVAEGMYCMFPVIGTRV